MIAVESPPIAAIWASSHHLEVWLCGLADSLTEGTGIPPIAATERPVSILRGIGGHADSSREGRRNSTNTVAAEAAHKSAVAAGPLPAGTHRSMHRAPNRARMAPRCPA
jgi:hypothetical protein